MNPTEKYTDPLLDEKFETVHNEMRALRDLPMAMGEMKGELKRITEDTNRCHAAVREMREDFERFKDHQSELEDRRRLERKSDRRWIVGTGLTSASLVIAAIALLADRV